MTPDELRHWRETLGISKAEAARILGMSVSGYYNYETGIRRGMNRDVPIPHHVALACSALIEGLQAYRPDDAKRYIATRRSRDTRSRNQRAATDGADADALDGEPSDETLVDDDALVSALTENRIAHAR